MKRNVCCLLPTVLSYSRHLLPEKLADFRERGEHAFVAFWVTGPGGQAKISGQFRIGRRDIFIAALAGKPAIKRTRNGASLFERCFADKRSAQVVHVGQLELVSVVVTPQSGKKFLVAQKCSQRFEHQRTVAGDNRGVLERIAIIT